LDEDLLSHMNGRITMRLSCVQLRNIFYEGENRGKADILLVQEDKLLSLKGVRVCIRVRKQEGSFIIATDVVAWVGFGLLAGWFLQ